LRSRWGTTFVLVTTTVLLCGEAFFPGHPPTQRHAFVTSGERCITTGKLDASVEGDPESITLRNLRFSGVGRLFTPPNQNKQRRTKDNQSESPHISVIDRLSRSTVLIVGLGGVGSWAAEAICRSGVGKIILMDLDDICISNTNRQLHATTSSIGKMKIDVMKERLNDINPDCEIDLIHDFISPANIDLIFQQQIFDRNKTITICLDAIDGGMNKAALIAGCARNSIPIVTCGGSAGKKDPTLFTSDDLTRVDDDRLLRTTRKTLRKFYGFEKNMENDKSIRKWNIRSIYSTERQKELPQGDDGTSSSLRRCDGALGTACFVTGTCGFVAAGEVISQIAEDRLLPPRRFRYDDNVKGALSQATRFGNGMVSLPSTSETR